MRTLIVALMFVLAGPALAQDAGNAAVGPTLPRDRPEAAETAPGEVPAAPEIAPSSSEPVTEDGTPLPRLRPDPAASSLEPEASSSEPPAPASQAEATDAAPTAIVVEPAAPRDYQVACPAVLTGQVTASNLPPIHEGQCGLQSPLSIEAVMANGRSIPLNAPVTTDCGMASALPGWVADIDSWLMAKENTEIETLIVGTHYMCRNVNNGVGGNLSFHAFGDALDVSGFTLKDGRTITVQQAWTGSEEQGSKIIRFAHDAACTHFTTTLGPEANAQHYDHLHIDLGCHGKTCTARLCE